MLIWRLPRDTALDDNRLTFESTDGVTKKVGGRVLPFSKCEVRGAQKKLLACRIDPSATKDLYPYQLTVTSTDIDGNQTSLKLDPTIFNN